MKKISMILIALLAAVTMSANKFARVTTAPTDWSGQYLIAYHTDSVEYVFNCKDENNGYVKAYATGDTIFSDELDSYVVEVAKMTSDYSVKVVSLDKYMSGTSGSNSLVFGTTPVLNTIAFHKADSIDMISNTSMFTFNSTKGTTRFRYYKPKTVSDNKKIYCHLSLYKAQTEIKPEPWTPDTISVSEARQLIATSDPLMNKSHYVKGVVASPDFGKTWPGWAMIWMTDIDNPADSLEGYKIYKDANSTTWASAEEIPCGLNDTVMLFADGLTKYGSIYETTSGYYVETLGKSSAINANSIFKHAFGALQKGKSADDKYYKYDVILSKVGPGDDENALHMLINSAKEKGIAGTYKLKAIQPDSSYVDDEGPVAGSLVLTYNAASGNFNTYGVKATFTLAGSVYNIDTTYSISGVDSNYDPFVLSDDRPFIPNDGDTITCAQAVSYAKTLGSATSTMTVWVRGYATGFQTIKGRTQQSVHMADDASATKGIFMGYLCYTQALDSIIKGDEILVKGNISYYAASSMAQISKGNIYRIGGSSTQRYRNPQLEARPDTAITVEEAMVIGNALTTDSVGDTKETDKEYTVYGYISEVSYQMDKDSASWMMSDAIGTAGDLKAYKCRIEALICSGDQVFVTGKISKFQKTAEAALIEISKGKAGFISLSTDIHEVAATIKKTNTAKKVLVGGQFYIVKDGVIYNAQGAVIR